MKSVLLTVPLAFTTHTPSSFLTVKGTSPAFRLLSRCICICGLSNTPDLGWGKGKKNNICQLPTGLQALWGMWRALTIAANTF